MQPSLVCLRCRLLSIRTSLRYRRIQKRNFVSFDQDASNFATGYLQEDIIPSKEKQEEFEHSAPRRLRRTKREGTARDSMTTVLEELFDANRHKAPSSTTSRYSRKPIEPHPASQELATEECGKTTDIKPEAIRHFQDSPPAISYDFPRATIRQPAAGNPGPNRSTVGKMKDLTTVIGVEDNDSTTTITRHSSTSSQIRTAAFIGDENQLLTGSNRHIKVNSSFVESTSEASIDGSAVSQISGRKSVTKLRNKPSTSRSKAASVRLSPATQAFRQMAAIGDNRMTIKLWKKFQQDLEDPAHQFSNLEIVFADFLWGFVNLRKLEPINEVWTVMIQQGVKPEIQHWNAVLEVLQKNQDLDRFERIWQNMLESGCLPNNLSWTTYIVALLQQRQWQAAIQVIDQMGKAWRKISEERLLDSGSKDEMPLSMPSIVPINAAITGLLRMDLWPTAQSVLQWAKDFPIDIDAFTYNIFLLHAYRRGDDAGAEAIIKDMEMNNIKQDVVTRTILLDKEVRDPQSQLLDLDPIEQEHAVVEKLQRMLDQGDPPNAHGFAIALHTLLHVAVPNLPAADAVLRLMRRNKIKIPPHIYTILFTYHFNSPIPDLRALDLLWETIEAEHSRIDHVLYDRMIEGYASIGAVGRMIHFFRKMTIAGKVPGWLALHQGLSSLVKQRRWDMCADFVSDVYNDGGDLYLGKRGWKGEKEFSQLVHELQEQNLIPQRLKS